MVVAAHTPCAPRLTVALADDCPAMREGLARLIADECDLAVAGSAASAAELRGLAGRRAAQVLVMDLMLGDADGLILIKDLREIAPEMKIVVFTAQAPEVYAARCLHAGAHGYVARHEAVAALFRAVRETAAGGIVVPAGVAAGLLGTPRGKDRAEPGTGVAARLTDRELQVFRLVGQALPTREVAQKLGVSVKTVEAHRENIKNKLDLASHAELVARAAQWLRESHGA